MPVYRTVGSSYGIKNYKKNVRFHVYSCAESKKELFHKNEPFYSLDEPLSGGSPGEPPGAEYNQISKGYRYLRAQRLNMSSGILYIANSDYLDEAERSAESVRNQTDLPIGVVTNRSDTPSVFDETITVDMPRWDWDVRIKQFDKTPFDKSLYLDTDTYVCGDVSGVFDLLEHFEIVAAHAPIRYSRSIISEETPAGSLPDAFPEFNCGVIGFKQSDQVSDMMDDWLEIFRSQREQSAKLHDQPAFRRAVLESEVRIATLPPEYNCRLPFPGYVDGTVKIIHGTANNYQEIANKINAREEPRTYNCEPVNDYWSVELGPKKTTVNLQSLRRTAKERGIRGVIERVVNKIIAR